MKLRWVRILIIGQLLLVVACLPLREVRTEPILTPQPDAQQEDERMLRDIPVPALTSTVELKPSPTVEDVASREINRRSLATLPAGLQAVPTIEHRYSLGVIPDELLGEVVADLAYRLNVPAASIEVVNIEPVLWNDGSLECPQPGVIYTHGMVPGYHLILLAGAKAYDYRVTETGYFFLCEQMGFATRMPDQ